MSYDPKSRRNLIRLCHIFIIIGFLNFFAFVAGAYHLGGDALNGKIEAGHYYVFGVRSESGHKVYTEVSRRAYTYSRWHAITLFSSWPLMFVAGYISNKYVEIADDKPPSHNQFCVRRLKPS